jgi:serine/threonine-protein kinase ATR
LRARAATSVGMHARALRLFEMLARSQVASVIFDASSSPDHEKRTRSRAAGMCQGPDLGYMKEALGALNDYETMECLMEDENRFNPTARIWGSIKLKEASSNFEGALQDYERALQLGMTASRDPGLHRGVLRCLLELGHFDSVLTQVSGLLQPRSSHGTEHDLTEDLIPLAVEASWRLGSWESLTSLVATAESHFRNDKPISYELAQGKIMLHLKNKKLDCLRSEIREARSAVMEKLSITANEGYSRAYSNIVQLHALRETEDIAELLCGGQHSSLGELVSEAGFGWDRRLGSVSSSGVTPIMNTRLALARLAGDASFEGALFLNMGRRARKNGLHGMAANALAQAEAVFHRVDLTHGGGLTRSSLQLQFAKLKHDSGESSAALRMLHNEEMEMMTTMEGPHLRTESIRRVGQLLGTEKHGMTEDETIEVFAKSALQSTQWMVEGGLKSGSEIMSRFRTLHRLAPKWEKGMKERR